MHEEEASTTSQYSLQVVVDCQHQAQAFTVNNNIINLYHPTQKHLDKSFKFETVLSLDHKNEQLQQKSVSPLLAKVFGGQNALLISYRTTPTGVKLIRAPSIEESNIIGIFNLLFSNLKEHPEMKLHLNFYQVYNSKIIDLLSQSKENLKVRETKASGVRIEGLAEPAINNLEQFISYYQIGLKNSTLYHTMMSSYSEGTHICMNFIIYIGDHKYSQLNIVELGVNSKKCGYIDGTVCTTFNLLASIAENKKFIPFRDSVITRVNKDSFKNTIMMLHLDPSLEEYSLNLSGLRGGKSLYKEVAPSE